MHNTCIVIPCYNESNRLPINVFDAYLRSNYEFFCFVDDGSTDNTYQLLESLKSEFPEKVQVIRNKENIGKAESVRNGVNYALGWKDFKFVGYFDADLATPLDEISHIMQFLSQDTKYGFALGSRIQRLGSNIERNMYRHYVGRIFATLASIVLELPVYDTQCGAKIIKSEIAKRIFDKPFISKWLFDIELIARVKLHFSAEVFIEVPLNTWKEIGSTKIKFIDVTKFPFQLFKIKRLYK